jgi:hypothetical protein
MHSNVDPAPVGGTLRARRALPLAERLRADAYGLVLVLILLTLFASGLVGDRRWGHVLVVALQGATMLFAQWTSRARRRVLRASAAIVLVLVAVSAIASLPDRAELSRGSLVAGVVLAIATIVVIARRIGLHPTVNALTLLGAVCIYLLIGTAFAYAYRVLEAFDPPFFASGSIGASTMLYYSFSTLTTVGYGDLTATSEIARMLSVTEALVGQLYLVTVIALVVGNVGRERPPLNDRPEGPH